MRIFGFFILFFMTACSHLGSQKADLCQSRQVAGIGASCRYVISQNLNVAELQEFRKKKEEHLLQYHAPNDMSGIIAVTLSDYNHEYYNRIWQRDWWLNVREILRPALSGQLFPEQSEQRIKIALDAAKNVQLLLKNVGWRQMGEQPRITYSMEIIEGEWGRPQNDGPAIIAMVATELANHILDQPQSPFKNRVSELYKAESPEQPSSIIKASLEYVTRVWDQKSFDIWEEKKGYNLYTMLAQIKALKSGAELARRLNDPKAADHYEIIAQKISDKIRKRLGSFWDSNQKSLVAIRDAEPWRHDYPAEDGKPGKKASNLDIAVILASNHFGGYEYLFHALDPKVMATALKLENVFDSMYEINKIKIGHRGEILAPAIGRYPEDVYNGHPDEAERFTKGHPWVLATLAMGEYHFRVAAELGKAGYLKVDDTNREFVKRLLPKGHVVKRGTLLKNNPVFKKVQVAAYEKGLQFLNRVIHHLGSDRLYSEMIERDSGQPQSIPSLAWSESSALSMSAAYFQAREAIADNFDQP